MLGVFVGGLGVSLFLYSFWGVCELILRQNSQKNKSKSYNGLVKIQIKSN